MVVGLIACIIPGDVILKAYRNPFVMVVGLIACIIPGDVILKAYRNPFIMVVGLIACIIPGNVRLRATYENLSVSYMDSKFDTYHIGSIICQRVS